MSLLGADCEKQDRSEVGQQGNPLEAFFEAIISEKGFFYLASLQYHVSIIFSEFRVKSALFHYAIGSTPPPELKLGSNEDKIVLNFLKGKCPEYAYLLPELN